jgi:hypothetical protein
VSLLKDVASFVRWRLVPVRYATRLLSVRPGRLRRPQPSQRADSLEIARVGGIAGPRIDAETLAKINAIYRPRTEGVERRNHGHPFVNLIADEDFTLDNPIMQMAFSTAMLDVAFDYFGGGCTMDSLQVLYSYKTDGDPRESQMWHLDYGDSKSLHYIAYLNDVSSTDDGPFVFADKQTTDHIGRSLIIRRIEDGSFSKEVGDGQICTFLGKAGDAMLVDPSACYHQGSRCRNEAGRLAVFITFSTLLPFVPPQPPILRNREKLMEIGLKLRPDLDENLLREMLMLPRVKRSMAQKSAAALH